MAHFVFEADLHGLLKLDTPIPNAPPARWQRKAKESAGPSPAASMSPMKPANRSYSGSKTPSKTPGERRGGSGVVPGRVGMPGGAEGVPRFWVRGAPRCGRADRRFQHLAGRAIRLCWDLARQGCVPRPLRAL